MLLFLSEYKYKRLAVSWDYTLFALDSIYDHWEALDIRMGRRVAHSVEGGVSWRFMEDDKAVESMR